MFTHITRNQSIYLISDKEIEHFNQIREELELVTLAIPSYFNRFQIWNILLDMWIKSSKDEQRLIEHPENALIYVIRKSLLTHIYQFPVWQRTLLLTKKNEQFAYLCSLYTLLQLNQFLTNLTKQDPDIASSFEEILPYISKDISGYFDASFQSLEDYPKQFALSQARVFQKFNELVPMYYDELHAVLNGAIKNAKDMYYLLYDTFI